MRVEPRVMHLFATMERGGAEIRTLELLEALGEEAREHRIVALARPGGALEPLFLSTGATTTFLRLRSAGFSAAMWRLSRRHEVVHCHLGPLSGIFLAIAWAAQTPVRIAHFRSDGEDTRPSRLNGLRRHVLRFLVNACATDIIGVSPGALEHGFSRSWGKDRRCRVIHSGLRLEEFQRPPNASLSEILSLPQGGRALVHVGRDHPAKNRELAIDIATELATVSDLHLVFIGRNDEANLAKHRLRLARAGVGDRVHWLGERDDVPQLLQSADALLSTSLREGLPGAVIEAIAAGIPVIASDIPGSSYLSEHFPGSVTLVKPDAALATWASAILSRTQGRPSQEDRARGLAQVLNSEFSQAAAVRHFRSLWRSGRG